MSGLLEVATSGHTDRVRALACSPDGRLLASGADDGLLLLWSVPGGELVWSRRMPQEEDRIEALDPLVASLAFWPDGRMIATAGDSPVRLWDTGGSLVATLDELWWLVAFSPDRRLVVEGIGGDSLRALDVQRRAEVWSVEGLGEDVVALAFTPDGRTLVVGLRSRVERRRAATGELVETFPVQGGELESLALSRDGATLALGVSHRWRGTIQVLDAGGSRTIAGCGDVEGLAISPDGAAVATTNCAQVTAWDTRTGKLRWKAEGAFGPIPGAAAFSPDGALLATGAGDGVVYLWEAASGREVRHLGRRAQAITALAFTPDDAKLLATTDAGEVERWDLAARRFEGVGPIERAAMAWPEAPVARDYGRRACEAASSTDGALVAEGRSNAVLVWDAKTGELLAAIERGDDGDAYPSALAFSPCGRWLGIGRSGYWLSVHEARSDREVYRAGVPSDSVSALAISRNGAAWACGTDYSRSAWIGDAGGARRRLVGHGARVNAVALTPDERTLITGSADGTVRLWTFPEGRPIAVLARPADWKGPAGSAT